jgi:hypothetical protein
MKLETKMTKIIWQTGKYPKELMPDSLQKSIKSWSDLNPDWEHRYVDTEQRAKMIEDFGDPVISKIYSLLEHKPVCQTDVWRYIVIYQYGGVYVDTDTRCVMPLKYILKNMSHPKYQIIIPPESDCDWYTSKNNGYVCTECEVSYQHIYKYNNEFEFHYNSDTFAAPKGSLILANIIEEMKDRYYIINSFHSENSINGHSPETRIVLQSAVDPSVFSKIIKNYNQKKVGKFFICSESHSWLKEEFKPYTYIDGDFKTYNP